MMKTKLTSLLLTVMFLCVLLSGCAGASKDALYSSEIRKMESPEWVQQLPSAQDSSVKQLFIVAAIGMDLTTATISMHERDADGNWQQLLSSPAYIGRNGLCDPETRQEGCGQTPYGIYRFNKAFGISPDPGCAIPYTQVDDNDYWSGDWNDGMHYNELVSVEDFPGLDVENSEHIVDYVYEYRYCLNISFNEEAVIGRGSGIFLHCLGRAKPFTAGCVAVPENIMKMIMENVTEDCVVVIDTLENLGGEF